MVENTSKYPHHITFRCGDETLKNMYHLSNKYGLTRSELIRDLVEIYAQGGI